MSDWPDRPRVEACFLNPALIAVILARFAAAYEGESGRPAPWPMAFLVPPIVLHKPTRMELPRDTRTHLSTWVTRHPLLRIGFPRRAIAMRRFVGEGLRLGLRTGALNLEGGYLRSAAISNTQQDGDLNELIRSASLLGRWFAHSELPSTPFVLFGVTP
jgi:hypothetical protein